MTQDVALERLGDSPLELADGEVDLRTYPVVDADGEEIGSVDSLYVDTDERKVRFLAVRGGGILGIGEKLRLVPVEAIHHVREGRVRLGHTRGHIDRGPQYDPELVRDRGYWTGLYGWYGYAPYWTPVPGGVSQHY